MQNTFLQVSDWRTFLFFFFSYEARILHNRVQQKRVDVLPISEPHFGPLGIAVLMKPHPGGHKWWLDQFHVKLSNLTTQIPVSFNFLFPSEGGVWWFDFYFGEINLRCDRCWSPHLEENVFFKERYWRQWEEALWEGDIDEINLTGQGFCVAVSARRQTITSLSETSSLTHPASSRFPEQLSENKKTRSRGKHAIWTEKGWEMEFHWVFFLTVIPHPHH